MDRQKLETRAAELGLKVTSNMLDETIQKKIKEAEDKAAAAKPTPEVSVKAVKVVGPAQGFRRIGRTFSAEPTTIPLDDLEEGQLQILEGEPNLMTSVIEVSPNE